MAAKDKAKVRLAINVDKELKDDFIRLAKENESDATKLVRAFMKQYVQKHKKKER